MHWRVPSPMATQLILNSTTVWSENCNFKFSQRPIICKPLTQTAPVPPSVYTWGALHPQSLAFSIALHTRSPYEILAKEVFLHMWNVFSLPSKKIINILKCTLCQNFHYRKQVWYPINEWKNRKTKTILPKLPGSFKE